jgi:hypothetical protein
VVVGGVLIGEPVDEGLELGEGGRLLGLGGTPLLHGLLEPLDFAAGAGVVGAGVLLDDAEAAELGLEAVATAGAVQAAAGQAGGEHHAVVGKRGGRDPVGGNGVAELGEHDWSGHSGVGGYGQGVAGVVVEPGQDLGVGAGSALWAGEPVVGEVGLPALVGLVGLEADVGGLRLLLRFGDDQSGGDQVPGDGGRGRRCGRGGAPGASRWCRGRRPGRSW